MRWIVAGAAVAVLATAESAAAQASRQDLNTCAREGVATTIVDACTRVIANERGSNRAVGYQNRGNARLALRQYDLAVADASEAISRNPNAGAYLLRASARYLLRDFAQAAADFSEAFRRNPEFLRNPLAVESRAESYLNLGDHRNAIADYDRVVALGPADPAPFLRRATAYQAIGDDARALTSIDEAIRRFPNDYLGFEARGRQHMRLRNYSQAIADYDAGIRSGTQGRLRLRASACWARAVAGVDLDTARSLCNFAHGGASNDPPRRASILDSLGLIKLKQRLWQEAWDDYNTAVDLAPNTAHYIYGRGIAALRLGRTAEGQADIANARRLDRAIAETYAGYGVRP